uniref:Putative LOC100868132 [Apis florea] n=1 Tax=Lepeophtheirus salmonis TaxID=72036 RepID=A0A0K2UGR7_LEPSM
MTRFARSKGSKASNEREPEEATPWSEMVQSLKGNKFNPEDEEDAVANDSDEDDHGDTMEVDEESGAAARIAESVDSQSVPSSDKETSSKKKRKRPQNKCLNCKEKGHLKKECPELSEERRKELQDLVTMKIERKGKGIGRKKNKKNSENVKSIDDESLRKVNKKNLKNDASKKVKLDITGKTVMEGEGLFQGFRVKLDDLPRLKKLEKDLKLAVKEDKINDEEFQGTLKKERRRAENDLARSKKMVCYLCRKPGHFLSDCPEAKDGKKATKVGAVGSCFKCGSMEHTSKDCESKLKGEAAYRFAVCFICSETGHLAKACPSNPKGLYPKGGGCRFCGSVEHLKSECRIKMQKVEKNDFKLTTLRGSEGGIEEDFIDRPTKPAPKKKKTKVVKF